MRYTFRDTDGCDAASGHDTDDYDEGRDIAAKKGLALIDNESPFRFSDHANDIGDWCPWSGTLLAEGYEDDRCPALCRASRVTEDEQEGWGADDYPCICGYVFGAMWERESHWTNADDERPHGIPVGSPN